MFTKTHILFGALIIGAVLLLVFARSQSEPQGQSGRFWPGTEVACLPAGHQSLAQHIHPHLEIYVDGTPEPIPANIGNAPDCMAELHTHDTSGQVHIETVAPDRTFAVADFFTVFARPFDREGFTRSITVNGEVREDESYTMQDMDHIVISYTSVN